SMERPRRADGRSREVPPSRRIAGALRSAIQDGELAPGALLPSERELARTYGAARNTARQAIALLQAEGLVDAQHGRGVFVRERRPLLRVAHDRYARRHREAPQGRVPRMEVTAIEVVSAPAWVAERLAIADGERVLRRRNRYLADEEPVQLAATYLPRRVANGTSLLQEVPAPGGIYAALETLGHRLARIDEHVTARMPLPEEAEALALTAGVPVIDLRHTGYDDGGLAIEVTHAVLPADRNTLTFELPVD
ncbi:MAG: GntR family transcriptional regulator, partial [Solirubrobacteraceae bacterium]|nr:GntR family transcriptional regulator [Solirubrobacteraceae bacterium]